MDKKVDEVVDEEEARFLESWKVSSSSSSSKIEGEMDFLGGRGFTKSEGEEEGSLGF